MQKNNNNEMASSGETALGSLAFTLSFAFLGALFGCEVPSDYFAQLQNAGPSPTPLVSPSVSPLPSPSPVACTQTCTVPNGVGIEACTGSNGNPTGSSASIESALSSTCTMTQCDVGFVAENGVCVAASASTPFVCTSYEALNFDSVTQQLTTASGDAVPARDISGSGACFYYPIVQPAVAITGPSYLTGTSAQFHDQDVVSRDHDVNSGSPDFVWHPYIMNHTSMNLTLGGVRSLNVTGGGLVGNTFTTGSMQVDNFFLVGAYPTASNLTPANLLSYYSAWGTGDSRVAKADGTVTDGIAFNPAGLQLTTNATNTYSQAGGALGYYSNAGVVTASPYSIVPLTVEAAVGTAIVPEIALTNYISPNVPTTIDFRALDCGGSRAVSNVYLIIQ